jgi:hypothetical protein
MQDLQKEFDELVAAQQELTKKFQATAQELFKKTTRNFFDSVPEIKAFYWSQYTPYFNDGDECVFSVHDVYFTNTTDVDNITWDEYEGEEENVFIYAGWGKVPELSEASKERCDQISKMIGSSEFEDVMKAMFGDHVKVIATAEGFDVQDRDHD